MSDFAPPIFIVKLYQGPWDLGLEMGRRVAFIRSCASHSVQLHTSEIVRYVTSQPKNCRKEAPAARSDVLPVKMSVSSNR